MYSTQQLIESLLALGLVPGDTVLVHSSFRSLGGIQGGSKAVFDAFMQVLGDKGTLVFPTLSFDYINAEHPDFYRDTTPSCVGYLSNRFMTDVPGAIRSLHATHSCCAWGNHAVWLTRDHERDETPVGPHSPLAKLPEVGGKILMLGCDPGHNTSLHGVEETAEPPYLFDRSNRITYRLHDGENLICRPSLRHFFGENGVRCFATRYERILPLLDGKELKNGKVLNAPSYLMSAPAVWKKGHEALLNDPYYFVERFDR